MMTLEERLIYFRKIDAAREASLLADPEIAAEYDRASQAWDSTIQASPVAPPKVRGRRGSSPPRPRSA